MPQLDTSWVSDIWQRIGVPRLEDPEPQPENHDDKLPENTIPKPIDADATPVKVVSQIANSVKGMPVRVLVGQTAEYTGADKDVDFRLYNAAHVEVLASGTTPVALLTLSGAVDDGAMPAVPIQGASQVITGSTSFDVPVGAPWLRVSLTAISGSGAAFTIIVTPYVAGGMASSTIASVTAGKLLKSSTVAEDLTLTLASTDYAATTAGAAGSKYLVVYCPSAVKVAMGAATSATNGVWVAAGVPTTFPVTITGTAADDTPHAQSATAGAVVTFTWMRD